MRCDAAHARLVFMEGFWLALHAGQPASDVLFLPRQARGPGQQGDSPRYGWALMCTMEGSR